MNQRNRELNTTTPNGTPQYPPIMICDPLNFRDLLQNLPQRLYNLQSYSLNQQQVRRPTQQQQQQIRVTNESHQRQQQLGINAAQQQIRRFVHPRPNRTQARRPVIRNQTDLRSKIKVLEKRVNVPLSKRIKDLEDRNKSLLHDSNKSVIEKVKDINREIDDYLSCPICKEDYNCQTRKKTMLNCKHCFCGKCLQKWYKIKSECPLCKMQNPTFTVDNNFDSKKKELNDIIDKIDNKVRKRKREEIQNPNKRRKIKVKIFWTEIDKDNVKCLFCTRIKKKKNINNHWWTCSKNKDKPTLEYVSVEK